MFLRLYALILPSVSYENLVSFEVSFDTEITCSVSSSDHPTNAGS